MNLSNASSLIVFNVSKIIRVTIQAVTILIVIAVIAACVAVGIVIGTQKISSLTQSSTTLIFQSNMSLIYQVKVTKSDLTCSNIWSSSNNYGIDTNLTNLINDTLQSAFPDSFLRAFITPLFPLSIDGSDQSSCHYNCHGKAFFNDSEASNAISNALIFTHPIILYYDPITGINSAPATFNRSLSNITDSYLTTLSLADLSTTAVANMTRDFSV